jgi:outer membrane protein OmpA-like peptidoglycan-associated protein
MLDQFDQAIEPDTGVTSENRDRGIRNWYEDDDVVEQRGNNIIIDLGNGQIYVQPVVPDDANRLLYGADDVEVQQLRGGRTRTIVYRRNGTRIVTLRDRHGEIIRRTRVLPDGTEIVLIDNRFDDDDFDRPPPILLDVPPPRIVIPRDQYIVDLGHADYDQIRGALLAPPVAEPERRYTLDEVLRNEPVRAYSPRIDLDTITFDFGSATIGRDQMRSLANLGQALEDVLGEHPDEVYLIEGHTDAVGSEYDNLILSDRRAEAVAVALSQNFDIPPENLITQGYGEQYLKVDTDDPERRNRRATVRRVTELLQAQN